MKISINSDRADRLDRLPVGQKARIGAPDHSTPTILRLMEMGLTEGALVQMTRVAPFGDPLELVVRGTRLCLRATDARAFPIRSPDDAVDTDGDGR